MARAKKQKSKKAKKQKSKRADARANWLGGNAIAGLF